VSTPLWVSIAVAGIGVAGTLTAGIAGALITQRWADQRDDKTWAREREREKERWRHEDEARTFEHRREVFEDFYQAVKALARRAYDHGYGFDDTPELPFDWNAEAAAKLNRLKVMLTGALTSLPSMPMTQPSGGVTTRSTTTRTTPSSMSGNRGSTMPSWSCWCSCARLFPYRRATRRCRHRAITTSHDLLMKML